jgi:hypothetical protein
VCEYLNKFQLKKNQITSATSSHYIGDEDGIDMARHGEYCSMTVPVFLSTIGGKTYELLRNLVAPTPPETLKLSKLTTVLKRHYEPKPLIIAERFHFHRRFQAADETIAEFMAELRRLSAHCDFESYLEQALRDRLVCGIRNENIQRRLLAEADLSLMRAVELAQGMEVAERNSNPQKLLVCTK